MSSTLNPLLKKRKPELKAKLQPSAIRKRKPELKAEMEKIQDELYEKRRLSVGNTKQKKSNLDQLQEKLNIAKFQQEEEETITDQYKRLLDLELEKKLKELENKIERILVETKYELTDELEITEYLLNQENTLRDKNEFLDKIILQLEKKLTAILKRQDELGDTIKYPVKISEDIKSKVPYKQYIQAKNEYTAIFAIEAKIAQQIASLKLLRREINFQRQRYELAKVSVLKSLPEKKEIIEKILSKKEPTLFTEKKRLDTPKPPPVRTRVVKQKLTPEKELASYLTEPIKDEPLSVLSVLERLPIPEGEKKKEVSQLKKFYKKGQLEEAPDKELVKELIKVLPRDLSYAPLEL